MTRLSSIFSFKTLQGSFRPGAAALLALAFIAAAEIGVRLLTPNLGWYEGMSSLGQWVGLLQHEVKTRQPEVWLMGNSILAYGIDAESLERQTGLSVLALPIGAATLAGDAAMLEYFLRRAPVLPKKVIFCITKDDLNLNGDRAQISGHYLAYDTWRGISIDRIFRLADSRQTLMNYIKTFLLRRPTASERHPSLPPFAGVVTPETAYYMDEHMNRFAFDDSAFPHIGRLSAKYQFEAGILLMPISRVYATYHDERFPALTCDQIAKKLAESCAQHHLSFRDYSGAAPDIADYFADPYHMTAAGRAFFTPLLAEALRPMPQGN